MKGMQDFWHDTDWLAVADNEYELLTALILDTQTPLERLRKVVEGLKRQDLLDICQINQLSAFQIRRTLKGLGYPWHGAKSKYIAATRHNNLSSLARWSYDDIIQLKGIGPKLASMWCQMWHGEERPVIDVHVKRWLNAHGHHGNYEQLSEALRKEAKKRHMSVIELDRMIVKAGILKRRDKQ